MRYALSMNRFHSLMLASILFAVPSHGETLPGPIPADIIRVVDGDTIRVRAHIWPDQSLEIMVRLSGIDAPEIHKPACSKERVLAEEAKIELETILEETIHLHDVHLGKYAGRVVAEARLPDGLNLAEHLVEKGLAVEYGTQDPWCIIHGSVASASRP